MIKMQMGIPARLTIVKNILSIFLIATVAFTWPLWTTNRLYPLFPGIEKLPSIHMLLAYALPSLLLLCLAMSFLLVKPRAFIFLSVLLSVTLLLLDAGRAQYWFYFYVLLLVVLFGYNWRVDNIHRYNSIFNAIKIVLAAVYLVAAIQHLQPDFIPNRWPMFIKPFERFWTPEQCAYLLKLAYVIPFIELFVVASLFIQPAKIAAISFAILFHVFSLVVLFLQPQKEAAIIFWHFAMILFVLFVFGGATTSQKEQGFSFSLYPLSVLLLFGIIIPLVFFMNDKPMKNKIDLMQINHAEQCIYVSTEDREKLPLYIQSFALNREQGLYKLSVTDWALQETKTRQVLGPAYLMKLTSELSKKYGADALVALPGVENKNVIALK